MSCDLTFGRGLCEDPEICAMASTKLLMLSGSCEAHVLVGAQVATGHIPPQFIYWLSDPPADLPVHGGTSEGQTSTCKRGGWALAVLWCEIC